MDAPLDDHTIFDGREQISTELLHEIYSCGDHYPAYFTELAGEELKRRGQELKTTKKPEEFPSAPGVRMMDWLKANPVLFISWIIVILCSGFVGGVVVFASVYLTIYHPRREWKKWWKRFGIGVFVMVMITLLAGYLI